MINSNENKQGFAIIALVLVAVIGFSVAFILSSTNKDIVIQPILENLNDNLVKIPKPTPTPFPFQEMTVPNLRSRDYESSLEELKSVSENPNYESFLTSYDSDGFKVNGLLTIPKTKTPSDGFPAIVFVHGYIVPENYRTLTNYSSYVDYLAKSDFVVFKIDLRGHGDSEGEAGGSYYSDDYIVDTLSAVSALKNSDFVDPKRIGLWGHSMAGNVTFRSFVASREIPALIIWSGAGYTYTDLQEYMIQDNSYRPPPSDSKRAKERQLLRETYGNFDPKHWFWKMVPATNYLENVTGAIQLNHAIDDNVVSIEYSRNLDTLLDKTEIVHELIEYPTGGHNLTGTTFNQAMQNTVIFYRNNL